MGKVKIVISIIILLFLPFNVFAKQGCCSHHDGVDCSQKQLNGKVICNDGWTQSSCVYSEMVKCQNTSYDYDKNKGKNNELLKMLAYSALIGGTIVYSYKKYKQ